MEPSLLQTLQIPIIFFFVSLATRAVFSFLETSITAMRLFKLKELSKKTDHYKPLFQALEKTPHQVLVAILIANSLADVLTAALATQITETFFKSLQFSSGLGFFLGIGIATIAIIIFGEIIPKNLAKVRGERLFTSLLWLINLVFYTFYPLVTFLTRFSNAFLYKIAGPSKTKGEGTAWISSEQEIQFLIDYIYQKGLMEEEKTEMLQNIFELGHTPVKEIMVPETDVISIPAKYSIQDTLRVFLKHKFTRLPVYEKQKNNIIGMVHQKDIFELLSHGQEKPLKEIVRPIMFIPESVKVNQLLREFRSQHMHIAMVISEHGGVVGLITLEDVLEEIVGEISDEHEPTTEKIAKLKQGGFLVEANITTEELGEFLNITFESEDSLTLGGFLTEQLQHLPKKGERILYKKYYFQIQKASKKRVQQVLIFEGKNALKV